MTTFGLVAEGPTDQIVLENILVGLFNNLDLSSHIYQLQPLRDTTDEEAIKAFGGWYKVFEYCGSTDFQEAFERIDYIIIQIDTDVSEEKHFDIKKTDREGKPLLLEDFINNIKEKFIQIIKKAFGEEFYKNHSNRILYAISVNEIECWLLPIFYTNHVRESTNNCTYKVNEMLNKTVSYYIDPQNKNPRVYEKISKPFIKHKELLRCYPNNPSFNIFIEELLSKGITIV